VKRCLLKLSFLCLTAATLPGTGDAAPRGKPRGGRAVLRLRNRTPFLVTVYIGGVRSGWIKPFRTERFTGLAGGYHRVYVASHYGSASWGPRRVFVPGVWNLRPPRNRRATEDLEEAMAARIYRRNRNSLAACDKLADRRGEALGPAEFEIEVSAKGAADVTVKSRVSRRLGTCYRAVAKSWSYPVTGSSYTVNFQHSPR